MARATPRRPEVTLLEDRSTPTTVGGTVFADSNGNSAQDAGEIGLANVQVQIDYLADGKIDATATTDSSGKYTISNVPDGVHTLTVTPPTGATPVGPTSRAITVAGNNLTGLNIGLRPTGSISGVVFADVNANGVRDSGEPTMPGTTLTLDLLADGSTDFATTAASDGTFQFQNVPDGTHRVNLVTPVNYLANGANVSLVTVASGNATSGIALGLRPSTGLSGTVYLGSVSAGSQGLGGLTVQLDQFSDGKIDSSTTTDASGNYYFANVPNGTHTVTVVAPSGSTFNTPDGNNSMTAAVAGNVQNNLDFAVELTGAVTGGLYYDANNNGTMDEGERYIRPGTVKVDVNSTGKLTDVTPRMLPDGRFSIDGLPDGRHILVVTPPGGYAAGTAIRQPFTITAGGTADLTDIAVRTVSSSTLAIGNSGSSTAQVYTFNTGDNGTLTPVQGRTVLPPNRNGARVLSADFNGDGTDDLITATGSGEVGIIRVYDGRTGLEISPSGGIQAFENTFKGGINLAAGDFNLDGKADIVVTADTGGGARVRILNAAQFQTGADPAQGKFLADFLGIDDAKFRGGARAAVGDLNGDGTPDLVVAAGTGGGPRIAIYNGTSIGAGSVPQQMVADFFAYEQSLRNGAVVSIGDINGDGRADLVVGAGSGGAPRVTVFSGMGIADGQGADSTRIADFYVNNDTKSRAGTRITVKDLDRDGKADVVASNGARAYTFTGQSLLAQYLNPDSTNGPAVAAELAPFNNAGSAGVFLG